jgi:hypothetical protein
MFDNSFKEGYQKKTVALKHNTIKGRKPTASDGRPFVLRIEKDKIKLHKSKAKNHTLASRTAADVSISGTGDGATKKETFGLAKSAEGIVTVTYMPRVDGVIPTINGSWKAKKIKDIPGPADSLYKTQIWEFKSKEFGVAKGTIQGSPTGASGTVTGWKSPVPGNPDAEKFEVQFGVQFTGNNISLLTFSKVY